MNSKPEYTSTVRLTFTTLPGFFAMGFGSGLAPRAPGTIGSLAALPLGLLLNAAPGWVYATVLVLGFLLGVYWCEVTSRRMAVEDPSAIVWDEMLAMWLVLALVPLSWAWWLAAFLLFRVFDIFKPWPVSWLDQTVKGGLGIMLDDLMAAVYALAILLLAQQWLLP